MQQKRHVRHSSHERGSNENFNGLLREFFPKGKSLNPLTDEELAQYLSAINERPRRLHQYKTSKFLFGLAQTA
ncbi:ISSag3 transposase [Streptococcus sanguinis SK49]|uniref:ISSag3 transposase n=1 Tax=Streptococcus sanguinis SK49 TaxID=888808 RepID=F3UXX9_STRSA|nr:ISSag3 transposase [Streptococcus sanguinis SK49]